MLSRCALPVLAAVCCTLAQAGYDEGANAYQRGDYSRALRELVPAADGDARAAVLLASMYQRGLGAAADPRQALLWLRRAGELGDIGAQLELARRYAAGSTQDRQEALDWYRRAAQSGSPDAQYELGRAYAEGRGVAPDSQEATRWMEQAAEAGVQPAAAWLAYAYEQGTGVEVDPAKAAYWRGRALPPVPVVTSKPRTAVLPPAISKAQPDLIDPACTDTDAYDCELAQRERSWRAHYGFGWYSGTPGPWGDPWFWGAPWYPGPADAWGWGRPYAGWGWGRHTGSGWSLGFSWGF